MTWRSGLLAAILLGTWSGWMWMLVVADPPLRNSLFLLFVVVTAGTVAVFWHYQDRLTPRLLTANLALGSVVHLAVAGAVVGAERLYALGLIPALARNWHHFLIGVVGIGAATFTWTRARGGKKAAVAVSPSGPEPPPAPLPALAEDPDWVVLARELAERQDGARLRQLDALERVSYALAGEESAPRRVSRAKRVVRQEALRLMAESQADENAEDDVLSKAAAFLEWGSQKLPELAELDVSDMLMAKAIADIRALHSTVERRFVDHRKLLPIHPIDRATAEEKANQRADAARAALPLLRANGMRLSEDLIAATEELASFRSVTGFQVVMVEDGYVTFEGNGRREALQRAFGSEEGVAVEVRVYRFDDPATDASIRRRVDRVRRYKDV